MSPSWRERWLVSLAPRRLGVLRFAPGLQPRLRDGAAHDYESEPGAPAWAAGVRLLGGLLEGAARPVSLSVVLSNHFVRYAVVPWTEGVRGESQRLAVARAQFLGLFGAEAAAWAAALEPARHGQPAMAAAVDAGLLDSLRALAARGRGVRLRSVQPHLAAALNACRRALAAGDSLALAEPGRLTIAFRRGDAWSEVVSRRVATEDGEQLASALRQCLEVDTMAGGSGSVLLLAPRLPALPETVIGPRAVKRPSAPDDEPWRAMARLAAAA